MSFVSLRNYFSTVKKKYCVELEVLLVNGEFSKISEFSIIKITKLFDEEDFRGTTSSAAIFCW